MPSLGEDADRSIVVTEQWMVALEERWQQQFAHMQTQLDSLAKEVDALKLDAAGGCGETQGDNDVLAAIRSDLAPIQSGSAPPDLQTDESRDLDEAYKWNLNCWDAILFMGYGELGIRCSTYTLFPGCLNACVQILLCFIINDALTAPGLDRNTVFAARKWRIFY